MNGFSQITIIGLGLIGGSLALALQKNHYPTKVVGFDRNPEHLRQALAEGAIAQVADTLSQSVEGSDLVVLAVPISAYPVVLREIAPALDPKTIVTDVGSVKGHVVTLANQLLPAPIRFVGGHPMAGSEKGGFPAAVAHLFENAFFFLTPVGQTDWQTLQLLKELIQSLKAFPVIVSPEEHDQIVAQISHIPHLAAVVLANLIDRQKGVSALPFVGGGFRDTTRIAAGNPQMWRDIFFQNKLEVCRGIDALVEMLREFQRFLQEDNRAAISDRLERAKLIRDSIPRYRPDSLHPLYEINVDVQDRPGVLAQLTRLVGDNNINIKDIEIIHAREGERGALRMGFETRQEAENALRVLRSHRFTAAYRKEDCEDADHPQDR